MREKGVKMEFDELKKRIEKELKLNKPDFAKDSKTSINIGELSLGPTQTLLFSLSNFRDKNYMDIRTWFQDQSGEWKHTKKGIHFSIDKFQDFEKLIKTLSDIAQICS